MKLFSLSTILNRSRPQHVCRNLLRRFFSSKPTPQIGSSKLYRRISPLGDPSVSIVPLLDQWVREGRTVDADELRSIIHELRIYKRFTHALEVEISQWMTDKRYICPSPRDVSTRLSLLHKVHGLKKTENYLYNIPENFKTFGVYVSMLNCHASDMAVEKAEAILQKLRDKGYSFPIGYNIMMNLYYNIGSIEKLDTLMQEMEEKGICDNYTVAIRLSAYAASFDTEGVDKMVKRMESDPRINVDWNIYSIAASGYLKVKLVDKALAALQKLETLMTDTKRKNIAFNCLLGLYAEARKKDELYRVWNLYKQNSKVFNKGYISMISGLMKFNDVEGAEKMFEEWESRNLCHDFQIPNILIDAYCKHGLLEKAEALLSREISKGGNPSVNTWYYLAGGYIQANGVPKAVDALKKAISMCPPNWKPSKDILMRCLDYLERRGDDKQAEEFIRVLKKEGIFSEVVHDKLLGIINGGELLS